MADERRRPWINEVEHLVLIREFNLQERPRRLSNAAYALALHDFIVEKVKAKREVR